MKLLRIAVKNLNSLYGEQEVDIEHGLGGAPLFLIMGPTGAGKSTLMDAVSLALFGQTPRLTERVGQPDEDARHVMSRGTAEARAQVEVQKVEGGREVRYRATWACHRSRGKADGNLQAPRRALERSEDGGQTWTPLVDDAREKVFGPPFAEMLEGLTVTDFKRSMLLAQGDFAAFLKADEAERATILERLTDTSRYKELGGRAARRRQEVEREKEQLEQRLGAIQVVGEAEEQALRAELERLRGEIGSTKARLDAVASVLGWRGRLEEIEAELKTAREQEARAAEAWEANRSEFTRLEENERCSGAAGALATLDRARADHQNRAATLPGLLEAESKLAADAAEAERELSALREEAERRAAALGDALPSIAEARKLKEAAAAARAEFQRAEEALKGREAALTRGNRALDAQQSAAAEAARAFEIAQQAVEAHAAARPLVESLAGLQARGTALEEARSGFMRRKAAVDEDAKKLDQAQAELTQRRAAVADQRDRAGALTSREEEARRVLEEQLQGAADPAARRGQLQDAQEQFSARLRALEEGLRLGRERAEHHEGLLQSERSLQAASERATVAADALAAAAANVEALTKTCAALRQERDDARELQSLARGRRLLEEGKECPVCGGADHPALRDRRFEALDARVEARCLAIEQELSSTEAALTTAQKDRELRSADAAAARVQCDELSKQVAAARGTAERLERAIAEALASVGIGADADLPALRESSAAELEQVRAAVKALDSATAAFEAAREAAREARARLEQLGAVLAEREGQCQAHAQRLEIARTELEAEESRLKEDKAALAAELRQFSLDPSEGIAATLARAAQQVKALQAADAACASAKEKAQEAASAVATAKASLAAMEAELGPARAQVDERRAACRAVEEKLKNALGGEDPDAVEKRLIHARDEAATARDRGTTRLHRLQRDLAAAEQARKGCEQLLVELQTARDEAAAGLDAALRSLGLGDERALRDRLLAPDEAALIQRLRGDLDRALQSARALSAAQHSVLERHAKARPEAGDLPEGLAELRSVRDEIESAWREQSKAEVLAAQKLAEQDGLRAQHGALQKALQEKQAELEIWERLHRLIGVNEGEGFKRYAQTLNLGELLARANGRLERLAPRYRLVGATNHKGEARLAFAVEDAFHAGETRPISTLSGGETFLVSLGLALALASYRSVKMPIETLLLDEGFGTLDPASLQVAMSALEALNASGTQVGIISHVEALKERIPARVVVTQAGSGRSTVRIENGSAS